MYCRTSPAKRWYSTKEIRGIPVLCRSACARQYHNSHTSPRIQAWGTQKQVHFIWCANGTSKRLVGCHCFVASCPCRHQITALLLGTTFLLLAEYQKASSWPMKRWDFVKARKSTPLCPYVTTTRLFCWTWKGHTSPATTYCTGQPGCLCWVAWVGWYFFIQLHNYLKCTYIK